MLAPLLDPARPVLDIGVGTGIVAAELTARGTPCTASTSPRMLSRARAQLGARVAVGDASRLPVRSGSVDQAVSTWLLHAGRTTGPSSPRSPGSCGRAAATW
ncbi:class I SAM-dependent methyltransferase [Streptomyces diastatochromogenes]|nr:class I SAM-dependent methyltransferase [Streptomyces diastatochromogenes]